ncbi:MAG: site-specific integrase [Desulfovibrionaceae bacterium]
MWSVPESRAYFVHKAVFSTGERFPVILHANTLQPAVLATRYIIDQRRDSRQASTLERDVRVLSWLYEWCAKVGIDLEGRLRARESLSPGEVQGVARWLRAGRHRKIFGTIGEIGDEATNQIHLLQPRTFNDYLSSVESFLVWAAYEFLPKVNPEADLKRSLRNAKRRITHAFKAFKAVGTVERAKRYGLTGEELCELRELTIPEGQRNPFRRALQTRNHLIIETMLATGVRRGELLKIRLVDLPRGPKQTISIVRQPDDPNDPRLNEPRVKTRSREIPIPKTLAIALTRYVQQERGKCKHQYLFVSSRGKLPLSEAGLNNLFSMIRKEFRVSDRPIHPHLLRHTFNDLLMEKAKLVGMTDDVRIKVQNFLNGWTEGSTQSEIYSHRFVEAEAMQLLDEYQQALWREVSHG